MAAGNWSGMVNLRMCALFLLCAAACGPGKGGSIVGSWERTEGDVHYLLELRGDGHFTDGDDVVGRKSDEGKYTYDGEYLREQSTSSAHRPSKLLYTRTAEVRGDTLILENNSQGTDTWHRVGH